MADLNEDILERDRLWCQALIDTLTVDKVHNVTVRFNEIRDDKTRSWRRLTAEEVTRLSESPWEILYPNLATEP